eukprot:6497452-Prymnesium_polylepis.2
MHFAAVAGAATPKTATVPPRLCPAPSRCRTAPEARMPERRPRRRLIPKMQTSATTPAARVEEMASEHSSRPP